MPAQVTDISIILAWALSIVASLPLLILALEVLSGLQRGKSSEIVHESPTTCILIPAHDEAATIKATLLQLRPLLPVNAYILVIADNCSDSTADIVRENGFAVVERFDGERRGKGYALAYGRDWLTKAPPECVVVFDADCTTDAKSLADLIGFSVARMSVMQAGYVFEADQSLSPKVQISNFAVWVKNIVRQRGASRLGGCAILTGTGIAFPWKIFANLPLATASIVEDLALTIDLARSGQAPTFLNQATVRSFAANEAATLQQRSRWEHGFIAVARSHGIPTLMAGMRSMDRKLLLLALHLFVPPIALLFLTVMFVAITLIGVAILADYWLPALTLLFFFACAAVSMIAAWMSGGYKWLKVGALLLLPMYIIWKIPIYLRYAVGQTAKWVRTDRNNDA